MTISFSSITLNDIGEWVFVWPAGYGTVNIVLFGKIIETTSERTYTYGNPIYEDVPPPFEIVPVAQKAPSERNLCRLKIQWHRTPCNHYVVEYLENATWVEYAAVYDDETVEVFESLTPILEDQTLHSWRVTAIDDNKREGTALSFEIFVVRTPDVPAEIELSCSNGILSVE